MNNFNPPLPSHRQQISLLPSGWVQAIDPNTGRIYYANATTGESSWDIPITKRPSPPPPTIFPEQHYSSNDSIHSTYHQQLVTSSTKLQPFDSTYHEKQHFPQQYGGTENHNVDQYYGDHNQEPNQQRYQQDLQQNRYSSSTEVQQKWPKNDPLLLQKQAHVAGTENTSSIKATSSDCDNVMSIDTSNINKNIEIAEVDPISMELQLLSAGQIADICFVQHQQRQQTTDHIIRGTKDAMSGLKYTTSIPIDTLQQHQLLQRRPMQELGRLHTRYYTLREQLKQQKQQQL